MPDESLLICYLCNRLYALERDGTFPTHDITPNLRALCDGSGKTPKWTENEKIARDYYRGPPGSYTGD